jgi:diaminopimelate decarboxylase
MRAQGVMVDAVSRGEILRALAAGYQAGQQGDGRSEIVFTADLFDAATLACVVSMACRSTPAPSTCCTSWARHRQGHAVWLRINPGFGHGHSNKTNTGGEHSKHGIWHTDLPPRWPPSASAGLKLVGLHMHIGSGVDYGHLEQVCGAMVELVRTTHAAGHDLHAISAGGGLSIPYRDGEPVIDTQHYHGLWDAARQQAEAIVRPPAGPGDRARPLSGGRIGRAAGRGARHQGCGQQPLSCWSTPASTS